MEIFSNITLNMQAPAYATVYSPQGQTLSRSIQAALMDGAAPWEIPETALCIIRYAKPDGTKGFYDTLEDDSSAYSYNGDVVTFVLATQALTVPGTVLMQLDFYNSDGEKLSTFTFRLIVAEGVFADSDITSSDYFNVLTATMAEAAEIFQQIKAAYGAPLTANTAEAMTDTSRIYVYTGTTGGGFTNGHWYYWDGAAWADGGVYNSNTTIDQTLTIQGDAADAKAAGDAVNDLKSAMQTFNFIINLESGSYASDGVTKSASVKRIRNKYLVPVNIFDRIGIPSGYEMIVYELDNNLVRKGVKNAVTEYFYDARKEDTAYINFLIYKIDHLNDDISNEVVSVESGLEILPKVDSNLNAIALSGYCNRLAAFLSMNANYFNANEAIWIDGFVNTRTGEISSSSTYEHTYVPLMGVGTYIVQIDAEEFGINNSSNFALFSKDKIYIGKVEADSYYSDNFKFILTEDNYKSAEYTVLQRRKSHNIIPKLFFNSIFTDVNDFPITSTLPLDPVYGAISDKLYKKVIICDGDSICHATLDKPYLYGGWFGRLVRNYQASGKNYAVSGGTITDMTDTQTSLGPRHSVALTIDSIYAEHPALDYLILEGGTNDADLIGNFVDDTPPEGFGTWDENDFSSEYLSNLDKQTFCGAVEYLFYKSVSYYPHSKIGFIIAMEMGKTATQANRRRRYFDEIIKIGEKWHIPILDLWRETHADARLIAYYDDSKTPDENVADKKFYNDGQHPTSYGYNLMQPIIEAWMKTL